MFPRAVLFFSLTLLLLPPGSYAAPQANPFVGGSSEGSGSEASGLLEAIGSFGAPLIAIQRELTSGVSRYFDRFKAAPGPETALPVLAFAFMYGFIHALLPGHRKLVLFGYFASRELRVWHGVAAGLLMAVLHAFTVLVVIGGLFLFAHYGLSLTQGLDETNRLIQGITSAAIVGLGLYLLIASLLGLGRHARGASKHPAVREPPRGSEGARTGFRSVLPFVLLSGLLPCPATSMIFLLSISLGVIPLGVLAVLALSLGMAIVMGATAVSAIFFKGGVLTALETRLGHAAHHVFDICGSIAFLAISLAFL